MTIKDVAKRAGVAVSTVSYALNGSPKVSEKTRRRIHKIAEDLGYEPNYTARELKTKKTKTIGLFLNDFSGPFYSELIRGIQEVVQKNGYSFIACSSFGDEESTAVKFIREKRIDAAIIFAPNISDKLLINAASKGVPIVVLDRKLESENIYSILINNEQGAIKAVNYLIGIGQQNLVFVSGREEAYDNRERLNGFKKAVNANGIEERILQGDFTENSGYAAAIDLIKSKKLPDAVFLSNDEMAIGMIKCFKEYEINVPEDVSIIGFDNITVSEYITPKLTTVSHPKYELGVRAAERLFCGINGEVITGSETLPVELIVRESCKEVIL